MKYNIVWITFLCMCWYFFWFIIQTNTSSQIGQDRELTTPPLRHQLFGTSSVPKIKPVAKGTLKPLRKAFWFCVTLFSYFASDSKKFSKTFAKKLEVNIIGTVLPVSHHSVYSAPITRSKYTLDGMRRTVFYVDRLGDRRFEEAETTVLDEAMVFPGLLQSTKTHANNFSDVKSSEPFLARDGHIRCDTTLALQRFPILVGTDLEMKKFSKIL